MPDTLKRLFILALLALGAGWYWTRWRPARDYKPLSGLLENAVNQQLAEAGVTDRDVVREVRLERSSWGTAWIESQREIRVEAARLTSLIDKLVAVGQKAGCAVLLRTEDAARARLDLGKGPHVMQRLDFLPMPPRSPEVALVIDDVAYDVLIMDRFAALGVPLTFAILPRDRRSKALAERAIELNFPVILHMPMEPMDLANNNPGPSGLYLRMNEDQLKEQFEKNIASVPYIQGINNHMGSAFTQDEPKMTLVMNWLKEKNLFFLDSYTSTKSVAARVAKSVGVPCRVNETFLDNLDDQAAIEKQLDLVLKLALERKQTIAIGHYRRKHLVQALAQKIPEFRARGVALVGLPTLYSSIN